MWKKILGKFGLVFNAGVYVHRFFDGCNDLRYELWNACAGLITWTDFINQIIPTMKYHLSGEFQKRIAEIYKEEHIGIQNTDETPKG